MIYLIKNKYIKYYIMNNKLLLLFFIIFSILFYLSRNNNNNNTTNSNTINPSLNHVINKLNTNKQINKLNKSTSGYKISLSNKKVERFYNKGTINEYLELLIREILIVILKRNKLNNNIEYVNTFVIGIE